MTQTMRICVLGNSHMGAAKRGWDEIARDHPQVEPVFFGAQMSVLEDLKVEPGRLVPGTERLRRRLRKTSRGHEEIVLAEYDAFLLYGLHFGPRPLLKTYRTFRPMSFEWDEPLPELPPFQPSDQPVQRVPEALFERAVLGWMDRSMALMLAEAIRAQTKTPVALVAAPGFSERVLDDGAWDGPIGAGDVARLSQLYHQYARRICPTDVALIMPREALLAHRLFTARAYAAPDTPDGLPDYLHTSARYGAEMMRHAVAALRVRLSEQFSEATPWQGQGQEQEQGHGQERRATA